MSYLVLFCSCVFSPFSVAITSLGEGRANLSAFRTFVRFALVWFCLFPLPVGVWEALCDCGTPWTFLLPFFFNNFRLLFFRKRHHEVPFILEQEQISHKRCAFSTVIRIRSAMKVDC